MAVNKQGKLELMNAAGETINVDPKNKVLRDFVKNQGFLPSNLMLKEQARQQQVAVEQAVVEQSTDPVVSTRVPASADGVTSDARRPLGGYIHAPEQTYKNRIETSAPLSTRVPDAIRPASIYEPQREITEADMNPYVQKASYASKGADTYEGIDGTIKQTPVNTDRVNVNPSFSGGQTATPGQAAPVPKQTFKEYTDLNKIARNPDYPIGVEELPPSQGVPLHPVTGLPIEAGGDKWSSYTDAPEGRTYNNKNFNWNNSSPGQVASLSQQEIDGLYGRPISPVQPKQEVDFSGIANWFRKNGFK